MKPATETIFVVVHYAYKDEPTEYPGWFSNEQAANAYALKMSRKEHLEKMEEYKGTIRAILLEKFDKKNDKFWGYVVHALQKLD